MNDFETHEVYQLVFILSIMVIIIGTVLVSSSLH